MPGNTSYISLLLVASVVSACGGSTAEPSRPSFSDPTVAVGGSGASTATAIAGATGGNVFPGGAQSGAPSFGAAGMTGVPNGLLPAVVDAGTQPFAGAPGGGIAGTSAPVVTAPPPGGTGPRSNGTDPVIPAPVGDCMPMKTGPFTFMGVTSQMWVGNKSDTQKAPIMIYWHGTGGTPATATAELDPTLVQEIMGQGGVIASIEGGLKGDTLDWGVFTTGDYQAVDQVVACAVKQLNIDTKRIYTSRASAGGLAAGELAYGRSSYMAAALPNSGGQSGYPMNMVYQDPTHIPAVMTMHGAMGVDKVVIEFTESSLREDNDIAAHGGFAIDCDHGGGNVAAAPDLKAAGWLFLKAHPFGVKPFPYAAGLPASFPKYCKIIAKM